MSQITTPKGGFTKPDNVLRCRRCFLEDGVTGPIVAWVTINHIPAHKQPWEVIGYMQKCLKCGDISRVIAVKDGKYTKIQVESAVRSHHYTAFTTRELNEADKHPTLNTQIEYDANKYTGPEIETTF